MEDIFEKVYEALKNFGEIVLNTEKAAALFTDIESIYLDNSEKP